MAVQAALQGAARLRDEVGHAIHFVGDAVDDGERERERERERGGGGGERER